MGRAGPYLSGQMRFALQRPCLSREAEIQWLLLVEYRKQPVLQRVPAAGTAAFLVRQHFLPAFAYGFGHASRFEQQPVERRQEYLRAAHEEGV